MSDARTQSYVRCSAAQVDGHMRTGQRDRLVQEHVPIVRDVVSRIGECLPDSLDFGDLAGHGLAALVEAADDYAGADGRFAEFAWTRVMRRVGALVTHHAWYKTRARTAALALRHSLAGVQGDASLSDAELAAALGIAEAGLVDSLDAVSAVMALEAREFLCAGGGAASLGKAIAELPKLEQTVLGLYFQEGLSLGEIAEIIGGDTGTVRAVFGRAGLMVAGLCSHPGDETLAHTPLDGS